MGWSATGDRGVVLGLIFGLAAGEAFKVTFNLNDYRSGDYGAVFRA